jgi:hypothetical protein
LPAFSVGLYFWDKKISFSLRDVKRVLKVIGKGVLMCAKHTWYVSISAWHGV